MAEQKYKDYVVVVQCEIVKQRCPGYLCEKAFNERSGGFAAYPGDRPVRMVSMTCGGCCGRAVHRKLSSLVRKIGELEGIGKERIAVQLSSCIVNDNFHGPPCPHLGYLRCLIGRLGLDIFDGTRVSEKSRRRREAGLYGGGGSS